MRRKLLRYTTLLLPVLFLMPFASAEELYRIKMEHNHRKGECQGVLIVRDDKVIFESRNPGCGRIIEYGGIKKIESKQGYEIHLYFSDREHGENQKYVLKFKSDDPDNQAALQYLLRRAGRPEPVSGGSELELPARIPVELDVNGNNCMGTLVLQEEKIVFETGSALCADRAFVREWDALKSYQRVKANEFLLIFYKYGRSAPGETTTFRFWNKNGPLPAEVEEAIRRLMR